MDEALYKVLLMCWLAWIESLMNSAKETSNERAPST